jgi:hypothetical protein
MRNLEEKDFARIFCCAKNRAFRSNLFAKTQKGFPLQSPAPNGLAASFVRNGCGHERKRRAKKKKED